MKIDQSFFERPSEVVAKELLGSFLVHKIDGKKIVGKIVETEAYGDKNDLASHARFSSSKRNNIMAGPAGRLYIYHIYGIFYLTNIVTGKVGKSGAILLRSAEITAGYQLVKNNLARSKFVKINEKMATGPGKLSLAFDLAKEQNDLDITTSKEVYLLPKENLNHNIVAAKRIGIDYAGSSKENLWRFYLEGNDFVSKK